MEKTQQDAGCGPAATQERDPSFPWALSAQWLRDVLPEFTLAQVLTHRSRTSLGAGLYPGHPFVTSCLSGPSSGPLDTASGSLQAVVKMAAVEASAEVKGLGTQQGWGWKEPASHAPGSASFLEALGSKLRLIPCPPFPPPPMFV